MSECTKGGAQTCVAVFSLCVKWPCVFPIIRVFLAQTKLMFTLELMSKRAAFIVRLRNGFGTSSENSKVSIKVTEHIFFSQEYLVFKNLYVKYHQFCDSKT